MIGCNNPNCKKWLHEECIVEDVLRKTYQRLVLKEEVTEAISPPNVKSSSGANGTKNPWDGLFRAKIKNKDKIATAIITDLREEDDENGEESKEDTSVDDEQDNEKHPKTWKEDIRCLVCHEKIQ
jgi:hypothetical protein